MATAEDTRRAVCDKFSDAIEATADVAGVPTFTVKADAIVNVCSFLKEDSRFRFDYLMSLSAVDWPDRFEAVYHLYSIALKHYATLKVKLEKANPVIATVTGVWKGANWQEREVYDMFGIKFQGHPDLTRILMDPDWEGFPLRKDYVEK